MLLKNLISGYLHFWVYKYNLQRIHPRLSNRAKMAFRTSHMISSLFLAPAPPVFLVISYFSACSNDICVLWIGPTSSLNLFVFCSLLGGYLIQSPASITINMLMTAKSTSVFQISFPSSCQCQLCYNMTYVFPNITEKPKGPLRMQGYRSQSLPQWHIKIIGT